MLEVDVQMFSYPRFTRLPLRKLAVTGALVASLASTMVPGGVSAQIDGCWSTEPTMDYGFPQWSEAPATVIDVAKTYTATVVTSKGTMVFELDPAAAPATVNSFVCLATSDYYDFTTFHRVIASFMIQGGDPTGTGTLGPGYSLPDELPEGEAPYTRGTLAMANAGANTGGSQFFVVQQDLPAGQLPVAYTVFGHLTEGEDVLDAISAVPVAPNVRGENSAPMRTVGIVDITISVDGQPLGA